MPKKEDFLLIKMQNINIANCQNLTFLYKNNLNKKIRGFLTSYFN